MQIRYSSGENCHQNWGSVLFDLLQNIRVVLVHLTNSWERDQRKKPAEKEVPGERIVVNIGQLYSRAESSPKARNQASSPEIQSHTNQPRRSDSGIRSHRYWLPEQLRYPHRQKVDSSHLSVPRVSWFFANGSGATSQPSIQERYLDHGDDNSWRRSGPVSRWVLPRRKLQGALVNHPIQHASVQANLFGGADSDAGVYVEPGRKEQTWLVGAGG